MGATHPLLPRFWGVSTAGLRNLIRRLQLGVIQIDVFADEFIDGDRIIVHKQTPAIVSINRRQGRVIGQIKLEIKFARNSIVWYHKFRVNRSVILRLITIEKGGNLPLTAPLITRTAAQYPVR